MPLHAIVPDRVVGLRTATDDYGMKVPDQDALAWDLLDAVRASLTVRTINRVSMTMAVDDYPAVIELLLTAAVDGATPLSDDLRTRLEKWVRFYSAHPSAALLRRLLADVTHDPPA